MAESLSNYLVQEIIVNQNCGENCYKVKHKVKNSFLIWKAYNCEAYTLEQLNTISNEVKSINNENILKYFDTIIYEPSNILYIVAEPYPCMKMTDLIERCKIQNLFFKESFIWKCLHQIASVVKHVSKVNINVLKTQININNVYVDNGRNIIFDLIHLNCKKEENHCEDMCKIGDIIYEMCCLQNVSSACSVVLNPFYSEDLQIMVNILLHKKEQANCHFLKPDIILHHPTVLLNLANDDEEIFTKQNQNVSTAKDDSAFESDESINKSNITLRKSLSSENFKEIDFTPRKPSIHQVSEILEYKSIPTASSKETYIGNQLSPTILALDLKIPGYVPRKESEHVKKWRSRLELCKEPQEVSKEALDHVWLKRLADIREREEALQQKELEMSKEKEKNDHVEPKEKKRHSLGSICNSMRGITLQPSLVQKVYKEEVNLSQTINNKKQRNEKLSLSDGSVTSGRSGKTHHHKYSSIKVRSRKKKTMTYEDLNSSLSADPGDSSMIQTSKKISSSQLPRPKSIHSMQRRRVHFNNKNNPFAEYDSVSNTVFTFFDIENLDASYEIPKNPPSGESLADRIAKFTYLDLEKMTTEKRNLLEEIRNTPPKVDRATKPKLKVKTPAAGSSNKIYHNSAVPILREDNRPVSSMSKASTSSTRSANSQKSVQSVITVDKGDYKGNTPPFATICKDSRRKPIIMDIDVDGDIMDIDALAENKENKSMPAPTPKLKRESKRRSILGFKTPFKFRI